MTTALCKPCSDAGVTAVATHYQRSTDTDLCEMHAAEAVRRVSFHPSVTRDSNGRRMFSGQVEIVRPLAASEADAEVGPMFEVRYLGGPATGETRHAFEDELSWDKDPRLHQQRCQPRPPAAEPR